MKTQHWLLGCAFWVAAISSRQAAAGALQPDNIARPACEAVPLMSSQKPDANEEVEKIADGDFATRWTSEAGTFPNWVEIRWPQPVRLNKLLVDEDPAGRSGQFRVDAFVDNSWKTLAGPTANATPPDGTLAVTFDPTVATRIRYHMLSPAQGSPATAFSSIRELQACGSAAWIEARKRMQRPSAVNGAAFTLVGSRLTPPTVKPGGAVRIELDLQVSAAIPKDYGFEIVVGEKVLGSPAWGADYDVARTYAWPSVNTTAWVTGRTYTVATELHVPPWAPHGELPVRVEPVGKAVLGSLAGGSQQQLGRLAIQRFARDPAPWPAVTPKSELRSVNGQARLHVNGKRLSPFIMTEEDHPSYHGFGASASAGFHMWRVCALKWVNHSYETAAGRAENGPWFQELDQQIRALLRCDPDAYILVAACARPSATWIKSYPDDAALMSNGTRLEASLSSPRWRRQVQDDYTELVKHLTGSDYAGHVLGVQFEVALETQYPGSDAGFNTPTTPRESVVLGDYSPGHVAAFREWLRQRYGGDVSALKAAWKDRGVTFDTARPDVNVLRRQDFFVFKDPALTRMPLDYWEFHNKSLADITVLIGRSIKQASGGKYLCGLWGFYSNGFRAATMTPGMQHYGFCEFGEVLRSPYIDYLVPLRAYAMIRGGTPAVPTNLADSIRQNGKMMLVEYDDRTFYCGYRDMPHHSQQETLALARRNWSASALRGDGLWWMGFGGVDFGRGNSGRIGIPWYAEDSVAANLGEGRKIYDAIYQDDGSKSISEVAVFMNSRDVYALDILDGRRLLASCQYQTAYYEIPKLGAPVDYYLLDDLALPVARQYKVYVFLNANYLTAKQRALVKSVAMQPGKTAVWLFAPGFCDGERLSTANIADLTGFTVGFDAQRIKPEATVAAGHVLTQGIPPGHVIAAHPWEYDTTPYAIGPTFYVNDPAAEPLATYTYNRSRVAYAAKTVRGARSIYLGVPYLDSVVLRPICRAAGVHLYSRDDAYIDATQSYLMITGGPRGFNADVPLPRASRVQDIDNRKVIGSSLKSFRASVPAGHTAIFHVAPDGMR